MVRSLKARLEKLEEYAGKTEYATTDECISLYVDCLRLADYKKSKKRMDELREMTGISEFPELDQ